MMFESLELYSTSICLLDIEFEEKTTMATLDRNSLLSD